MTHPMTTKSRPSRILYFILLCLLLLSLTVPSLAKTKRQPGAAFKMPKEDPYKVLGIKFRDRNNLEAIKKAYHSKAKTSHPDKNLDNPEKAAENFRRVAAAWEFLSDPGNKRTYDYKLRKGFGTMQQKQQQQQRMHTTTKKQNMGFTSKTYSYGTNNKNNKQEQKQKKQPNNKSQILRDAREAQQKVLKLTTLEQLQSTLLDRNQRFKKHFFGVFVAGKKMDRFVDNELLFPYPFGPKGRNQIDWEPLLQAAKIRYNGPTPLTQSFRAPSIQAAQRSGKPYIVFCKKGDRLDQFKVYRPKTWSLKQPFEKLEQWVLEQLTAQVTVVNHHHATIQIYVHDDGKYGLQSMGRIPPGHEMTIQAVIADRVVALDANIDTFPGGAGRKPVLLQKDEILKSVSLDDVLVRHENQVIEIGPGYGNTRRCYDLSLQCSSWAAQPMRKGQLPNCQAQLEFAHTICPHTCGVCIDSSWNGVYYSLFHLPLHKVPTPPLRGTLSVLRSTAKFGDVFFEDFGHLWSMRRNVTVMFLLTGFLAGIQIVIVAHLMTARSSTANSSPSLLDNLGLVLLLTTCMAGWGMWMSQAELHQVPAVLRGFHIDLLHMVRHSMDAVYGLLYLGFLSLVLSKKLVQRRQGPRRSNRVFFLVSLVTISTLMILGASHLLKNDLLFSGKRNHRYVRWAEVWKLRKNVALTIFALGCLLGASTLGMGRFVMQSKQYMGLSVLNISVFCFGIGLALRDRHFLKDLDHVLHMRMSAAIPCAVLGIMWGMSLAHTLSTYQVKLKVD